MKNRVLIVDDDPSIRASLNKILDGENYEVILAADAQEAMVQFVPAQIDLVLLDLNLSSESGWDVFDRLTTRDPLTPIIIITGLPHQFPTALAAGVGAVMEKPIEVPALLNTMAELLAEPKEKLLRRLCGYLNDTRHVPPAGTFWVERIRERVNDLTRASGGDVSLAERALES